MRIAKRFLRGLLSLGLAFSLSGAPTLACVDNLAPQSGAAPAFNGKFVFQAIDSSQNDHIYLYDSAHPGRVQIDAGWGFTTALNPNLSRNGLWVAFGATSPNCNDGRGGEFSQIYVYLLGSPTPPQPLVACDQTHREDIKFSADMGSVVFKRRPPVGSSIPYSLETLSLRLNANGTADILAHNVLVQDSTERSAPGLTPMSNYVYYNTGSKGAAEAVHRLNLVSKADTTMTPNGVNAYYPNVRDTTTVLYSRNLGAGAVDQLYYQTPSLDNVEHEVSFNDCQVNNSDPAPLNEDYILFSRPGPSGDYELFVGLMGTTKIWSLSTLLQISGGTDPIHALLGSSFYSRLRGVAP